MKHWKPVLLSHSKKGLFLGKAKNPKLDYERLCEWYFQACAIGKKHLIENEATHEKIK